MPHIVTAYNLDTAVAELSDARIVARTWLLAEDRPYVLADMPPDAHGQVFLPGTASNGYRSLLIRPVEWADVAAGANLPRPSESAAARFPNVLLDAYNRVAYAKGFSK